MNDQRVVEHMKVVKRSSGGGLETWHVVTCSINEAARQSQQVEYTHDDSFFPWIPDVNRC